MARSRARARLNWVSHGQRLGRCRVNRRAERVSRPTRAMRAVQRARCVKGAKKMGHWGVAVQDKCPFKWPAEMSLGQARGAAG